MVTDGAVKAGGEESGYKPTELLLYGVAGCTGIDVIRILKKQRQDVTGLRIEVTGHQNDGYPKPFHTVEIKFVALGNNIDPNKLAKAIELSEGKFCVVSQTLQQQTTITTSYDVEQA
jgi:putative redox protein